MTWRFWILLGACVALWSCAGPQARPPEAKLVVQRVDVPVPVKCAAPPPPEPLYADNPAAIRVAPNIFEVAKLRVAGRLQRDAYAAELKASRAGCD